MTSIKQAVDIIERTRHNIRGSAKAAQVTLDSLEYDWETSHWTATVTAGHTLPPVNGNLPGARIVDSVTWSAAITVAHVIDGGDGTRFEAEAMFAAAFHRVADAARDLTHTGNSVRRRPWV